ncbi:hypothetical protein B0H14DRAFT_2598601 [Mycena olivaceomarginata]|nr:hypothetical protein B0H14DRAFT_2598601 [Mycena olivaceomarginata]
MSSVPSPLPACVNFPLRNCTNRSQPNSERQHRMRDRGLRCALISFLPTTLNAQVVDFHSERIDSENITWVKNFEPSFGSSPLSLPLATDFWFLLQYRCIDCASTFIISGFQISANVLSPKYMLKIYDSTLLIDGAWTQLSNGGISGHGGSGSKYGHDLARS